MATVQRVHAQEHEESAEDITWCSECGSGLEKPRFFYIKKFLRLYRFYVFKVFQVLMYEDRTQNNDP